ncbi:MAG: FAD:protein FMN transferase [Bacteroidota bacterium]|nr:FAD:protein FMN transferase [Bacteroidota bacterium]
MKIQPKIYTLLILFLIISCNSSNLKYHSLQGETMGTIYHIKYQAQENKDFKKEIDSLLINVNNSLSTFIPTSTISRVNKAQLNTEIDAYFETVFQKAKDVYLRTNGSFDPTVMPLVNAWGFGYDTIPNVDSNIIDSLLTFIGFNKILLSGKIIKKKRPEIQLDFSAIAKGFGVDVISKFLIEKGIENFMVEIGGEVRVLGKNSEGNNWKIGIEKPDENKRSLNSTISFNKMAIASSGNYRNFYYKNGKRFAHTINPKTGYPVDHNLLSVSVFANDCMTADAYATAFMVMGVNKAIEIDKAVDSIAIHLIYEDENALMKTFTSEKLRGEITKINN